MKKTMKSILLAVLSVICACCFVVGCGGNGNDNQNIGVTLDRAYITLAEGEETTLFAAVTGTGDAATWSSSDTAVASVNNGTVKGIGQGSAVITAKVGEATASCNVTVKGGSYFPTLVLSKKTISMFKGESVTVKADVTHKGVAVSGVTVNWSSDDEEIVTVEDGVITAVGAGTARVIATATYLGETLEESVLVTVPSSLAFMINEDNINLFIVPLNDGEIKTKALTYTALYNDQPIDGTIEWESKNQDVVTVDNGTITAVGKGTADIVATFTASNSETTKARATVTVNKSVSNKIYSMGDVDMSLSTYSLPLSTLEMTEYSGEATIRQGKVTKSATVSGANLNFDPSGFKYGEGLIELEFDDRILNIEGLFVTKILYTPEDILKIEEYAGGKDSSQAYDGYFVMANNIDMSGEDNPINTAVEADDARVSTRGFQGVFDGRGHSILNAYFTGAGGLFGTVGEKGEVRNISVVNATLRAPASVGSGVICQKFFGVLENAFVSVTVTGPYTAMFGLFYVSTKGMVKDVVVEFAQKNATHASGGGTPIMGWVNGINLIFENVYAITEIDNATIDQLCGTGAGQIIQQGNGVKGYKFGEANMQFSGFDSDLWNTGSGIPTFKGIGSYSEEHYLENDEGEYDLEISYTGHGVTGSTVTATMGSFGEYMSYDRDLSTVSGQISDAEELELKLYYPKWNALQVKDDDGNAVMDGEKKIEFTYRVFSDKQMRYTGQFNGVNDAYKFVAYDPTEWDNCLSIRDGNESANAFIVDSGYKTFTMKIYFEDPIETTFVAYFKGQDTTYVTGRYDNPSSLAAASEYIQLVDASGKSVVVVQPGTWYTIIFDISHIDGTVEYNLFLHHKNSRVFYLADPVLSMTEYTLNEGEVNYLQIPVNFDGAPSGVAFTNATTAASVNMQEVAEAVDGKNDVYSLEFFGGRSAAWNNRLALRKDNGWASAYIAEQGYKKMTFNLRFTTVNNAESTIYFMENGEQNHYTLTYTDSDMTYALSDYINFKTPAGYYVNCLSTGGLKTGIWYEVQVNLETMCEEITNNFVFYGLSSEMIYVQGFEFSKDPFKSGNINVKDDDGNRTSVYLTSYANIYTGVGEAAANDAKHNLESAGTVYGMENAYKFTCYDGGARAWYNRIYLRYCNPADGTKNNVNVRMYESGYQTLKMSIYFEDEVNTSGTMYATGGLRDIGFTEAVLSKSEEYMRVRNSEGNIVTQVVAGQWYEVEFNLNLLDRVSTPHDNILIYNNRDGGVIYLANVTLSKAAFN